MSIYDPKLYGETLFRLVPDRPVKRAQEVHTLTQRWQAPSRDQFALGAAPDGWPNMRIVGIEPETEIDDMAYDLRLDCEGILDDSPFLELDSVTESPEEGWDTKSITIYTREPDDARWRKGSQILGSMLTGVTASGATNLVTKADHGLTTGQVLALEFSSGFGGLTSGVGYYVHVVSSSTLLLALTAESAVAAGVSSLSAEIDITGVADDDQILATAHGLNNGDAILFLELDGGMGLTALLRPYYVVNKTTDDFQVSLTVGGAVVALGTDIEEGVCRRGTYIDITSDGASGTALTVTVGMQTMWITDRRKRDARAKDYYELDLQLKGLLQGTGDMKLVKRRGNTTAQALGVNKYNSIHFHSVVAGWPPQVVGTTSQWFDQAAIEADLPQISVTDTMISTEPPPTWLVPGFWIPPDAPSIMLFTLHPGGTNGAEPLYHLPWGWKTLGLQWEQIPGKPLYLISLTWGYQSPTTIRSGPDEA